MRELGFKEAADNRLVAPPRGEMGSVQGARVAVYALWCEQEEQRICVIL